MNTSLSGRMRGLLALALAAALAAGCGGGGGSDVGSGGTGAPASAFAQGPISGFGSIVVNGVHFDDSQASISDEDGHVLTSDDLHLGTTVDLQGSDDHSGEVHASVIHVRTDLVGTVTAAWDPATGRLAVLGQPVLVDASTALDDFTGGAGAIAAGSVVAVHALYDPATGVYVATRIEPATGATAFVVRGTVAALDTAAQTFAIGGQVFSYAGVTAPAGFADGQVVRVRLQTAQDGAGRWVVTGFSAGNVVPPEDHEGELEGVVGALTDAAHFTVAGIPVDASQAVFDPAGSSVVVQSRVEIHGTMTGGVLVATTVEVKTHGDDDNRGPGHGGGGDDGIEIDGPILTAIDTVAHTFGMRGPTTVDYTSAEFHDGTAADLATGRQVEVKGALSADGTRVIASRIEFR